MQKIMTSKKHVCFLQHMNMCEKNGDHSTSVNFDSFQSCFQIELDQNNNKEACISSQFFLCIDHYKKYKKFKPQLECCICDKSIYSKRFVGILDDKIDMLNIYINQILEIEQTVVTSTFCKTSVCLSCYKHFNIFLRSEKSDLAMVRTDQFLEDCFSQYEVIQTDSLDSSNIEIFCFRQLLEYVIENLKSYRSLLVSSLHLKYKKFVDSSIQDFSINIDNESICQVHKTTNWVYQMLKSTLGPALLVYSPPKKSTSRMVYRVGTDLAKALHSSILHNKSKIDKLEESNQAMKKQIGHMLSDQDSSLKNTFSLEDSLKMLRGHVKSYVSESIKSTNSQPPDIHDFDLQIEISKIHPVLWNFIFRMTTSEDEEKMLRKDTFDWENHYVKCSPTQRNIENIRFFPRLFISSCIFNTFHSHCTQPLHLLMTDIVDKYSGSSSDLLLINSRMGAGVSKDTLKRYINNKSIQLEVQVACWGLNWEFFIF